MACLMYSNAGSFLCMSRATLQRFMPTVEQGSEHSACLHTILRLRQGDLRPQLARPHPGVACSMQHFFKGSKVLVAHSQELVSADKEPIQPYINNISALAGNGVSSILVMGSSGCVCSV